MSFALKALTVSSDPLFPKILNQALAQHGVELVDVPTVTQAKKLLASRDFAAVFCETKFPDGNFLDIMRAAREHDPKVPVVVTSYTHDWDEYLETMRVGAFDFIARPYAQPEVARIVSNAVRQGVRRPINIAHAKDRRAATA